MSNRLLGLFERVDSIFGLSPPEIKEIEGTIYEQVSNLNDEVAIDKLGITGKDVVAKTIDAGEREEVVNLMGKTMPILSECESWGDVVRVMKREGFKIQREVIFVQIFAGGLCLVLLGGNVNSIGKFVLGPFMVKLGYENSEFLKNYVPNDFFDEVSKMNLTKLKE